MNKLFRNLLMVAVLALALAAGLSATSGVGASEQPTCKSATTFKTNLGSELVVFASPVRPMVEIERVPGPLGNGSVVHESDGPEFDPKTHVLRPGNTYHMWARITNYGGVDQARFLSMRKVYEGIPAGSSGPDLLKDDEGIATLVREYKTDATTKHLLGEPGWGSARGPVILAASESKTFLISFTLGERIPKGNWQLSLALE